MFSPEYRCVLQEEVQIRPVTLIRSEKKEAIAQIHSDGFPVYNYDNPNDRNNYCPVMSDNEEEDMADAPDNDDLPPGMYPGDVQFRIG